MSARVWLAANLHHRGAAPGDRLLAEVVAPLLLRLEGEGGVRSAWGTRFDARGPHLFLLVGVEPGAAGEVGGLLVAEARRHLALHPSDAVLSPEELERRHAECRGRSFWAADRRPGIAAADTVEAGAPEAGDFPGPLVRGMDPAAEAAYWRAGTELFHWCARRVGAGTGRRAALVWAAALDRALGAAGAAEAAWRHHACTLLPALEERLREAPDAVLASLPGSIGDRNRALFDAAWKAGDAEAERIAADLVRAALAEDARSATLRLHAVRTALHGAWLLLGLSAAAAVPLALHAWMRSLDPAGAAP